MAWKARGINIETKPVEILCRTDKLPRIPRESMDEENGLIASFLMLQCKRTPCFARRFSILIYPIIPCHGDCISVYDHQDAS